METMSEEMRQREKRGKKMRGRKVGKWKETREQYEWKTVTREEETRWETV